MTKIITVKSDNHRRGIRFAIETDSILTKSHNYIIWIDGNGEQQNAYYRELMEHDSLSDAFEALMKNL